MPSTWLKKILLFPLFLLMGVPEGEGGAEGGNINPPAAGETVATPATSPEEQAPDAQAEAAGTPAADKGQAGAPETCGELTIPEQAKGIELVAKALEAFKPIARELDLPQEKAQLLFNRLLGEVHPRMEAQRLEAWNGIVTGWVETARTDKEIGGERFAQNVEVAQRALNTFGTPELKATLNQFGLGNHPELIRLMVRMGNAMREDTIVLPGSQPGGGKRSVADRLYGNGDA